MTEAGVKRAEPDEPDAPADAKRPKYEPAPVMDAAEKRRKYESVEVAVCDPVRQVVISDAGKRLSKWGRMKRAMLEALGREWVEAVPEPAVVRGEAAYCVATAPHPFTGETVCLVEKSRGGGYVLVPDQAVKTVLERGEVVAVGQQYSNWTTMEEKMNVSLTPGFKASLGQVGFVLAREPHPRDPSQAVLALEIPEGGTVLVKSTAVRSLPVDVVEIADPLARYHPWPKMAEALALAETAEPHPLAAGQVGIVRAERRHFTENDTVVAAVELLNDGVTVMMDTRGLKQIKF
eukprot:TRINITY_DN1707_c0_g1_i1.p1 TRINITY_DN1707_c0_g1~~TRINITY_DN1707_c0_g1_i1.p1  ORF type:complete len:291 (+),score=99.27 TRINITY_DN1707_c0_g1_i1:89-961(+)